MSKAQIVFKSLGITTLVVSSMLAGSSPIKRSPLKATGEIIGIVENASGRVADAVVSLSGVTGNFNPPSAPVRMDQKDKLFAPHVLAVMKGTTVRFDNSDPFFHNVFSSSRVKTFNVSQEKRGDTSSVVFDKIGLVPIRCHIHANMKAYIVVLANPYFDVTNEKGQFRINDVPAGSYTIKVWSEKGTSTQTVDVKAGDRAKVIFKVSE
jgi:plastocyanin